MFDDTIIIEYHTGCYIAALLIWPSYTTILLWQGFSENSGSVDDVQLFSGCVGVFCWMYGGHIAPGQCQVKTHSHSNQQLHHLLSPNEYMLQMRQKLRELDTDTKAKRVKEKDKRLMQRKRKGTWERCWRCTENWGRRSKRPSWGKGARDMPKAIGKTPDPHYMCTLW